MTETFTASNGVVVAISGDGYLIGRYQQTPEHIRMTHATASTEGIAALREFFLHEAGIWVDPETGAHVYRRAHREDRDGRCVLVVTPEESCHIWEKLAGGVGLSEVAARYFAAHLEPKAWHSAKPGEVWIVTIDGGEYAAQIDSDREFHIVSEEGSWRHIEFDMDITAARRIWPEAVSDA